MKDFISTHTVGADIEFGFNPDTMVDILKTELEAQNKNQLSASFGIDGAGNIPEIRIPSAKRAKILVKNIRQVLEKGAQDYPQLHRAQWLPWSVRNPTGFHIHFGHYPTSRRNSNETERTKVLELIQQFDKFITIPSLLLSKENAQRRWDHSYGRLADWRWNSFCGFEWRSLNSAVMANPALTEAIFNTTIAVFNLFNKEKLKPIGRTEKRNIEELHRAHSFYGFQLLTEKVKKELLKIEPELAQTLKVFYNKRIRKVEDLRDAWDLKYSLHVKIPDDKELILQIDKIIDDFDRYQTPGELNNRILGGSGYLIEELALALRKVFGLLRFYPMRYQEYLLTGGNKTRGSDFQTKEESVISRCTLYIPYELRSKEAQRNLLYKTAQAIIKIEAKQNGFAEAKDLKFYTNETQESDRVLGVNELAENSTRRSITNTAREEIGESSEPLGYRNHEWGTCCCAICFAYRHHVRAEERCQEGFCNFVDDLDNDLEEERDPNPADHS